MMKLVGQSDDPHSNRVMVSQLPITSAKHKYLR